MIKEKSMQVKIDGKNYILKFRKQLFDNTKFMVELLKEKGKHELIEVASFEIDNESEMN